MKHEQLAIVILAAGNSTRMQSSTPKVLHKLAGVPIIHYVVQAAESLQPAQIITVARPRDTSALQAAVSPHLVVIQPEARGTADAVNMAAPHIKDNHEYTLILCGDVPLITPDTLGKLIARIEGQQHPGIVVLGMELEEPKGYGRLITAGGQLLGIVEDKDTGPDERDVKLCNSGVIIIRTDLLKELLPRISNHNAQKEFYLTDLVKLAVARNILCLYEICAAEEVRGINSRADLAAVSAIVQQQLRAHHLAHGVTMMDPDTVYFSHDTQIGPDCTIGPYVVFGPSVILEPDVEILPFCHLAGSTIKQGARIGPFAHLRPHTVIGQNAKVGNFVELKQAVLGPRTKVNHLSYLGDAAVGEGANVGAGTITCNYDGFHKSRTIIEQGAFIGSNTALVAPVNIGADAIIAAGSVITQDVPSDSLALSRTTQVNRADGAKRFRRKKGVV